MIGIKIFEKRFPALKKNLSKYDLWKKEKLILGVPKTYKFGFFRWNPRRQAYWSSFQVKISDRKCHNIESRNSMVFTETTRQRKQYPIPPGWEKIENKVRKRHSCPSCYDFKVTVSKMIKTSPNFRRKFQIHCNLKRYLTRI